jgi:LuxR family maltose regulon positive regulatory protein
MTNVPAMIARGRGALAEFRGDAERALAFGRRAMALVGEGEHMLEALSRVMLGRAERLGGRLDDAEQSFNLLIERSQATAQPTLVAWACHYLGQVQQARGDLDGAGQTFRRAREFAPNSGQSASLTSAIAYLGLAELAYQRGELDDALDRIFCAVADPALGLREVRRVTRRDGRVLLLEHVRPENRFLGLVRR